MKRVVLEQCLLLLSVVLLSGCRSDEERCETLCQYLDECTVLEADCIESELENCAENVEDLGDACRDSFEGVTDCLDDNENDCEAIAEHCQGETNEVFERCPGLL